MFKSIERQHYLLYKPHILNHIIFGFHKLFLFQFLIGKIDILITIQKLLLVKEDETEHYIIYFLENYKHPIYHDNHTIPILNHDFTLQWSAVNGHLHVIKFLIEKGADIHASNDYALSLSAENGHLDVVKFLVENGANIHASNDLVLRWCAFHGHLDVVKFLVENGANIHANNDLVLGWCDYHGKLDVYNFLKNK